MLTMHSSVNALYMYMYIQRGHIHIHSKLHHVSPAQIYFVICYFFYRNVYTGAAAVLRNAPKKKKTTADYANFSDFQL